MSEEKEKEKSAEPEASAETSTSALSPARHPPPSSESLVKDDDRQPAQSMAPQMFAPSFGGMPAGMFPMYDMNAMSQQMAAAAQAHAAADKSREAAEDGGARPTAELPTTMFPAGMPMMPMMPMNPMMMAPWGGFAPFWGAPQMPPFFGFPDSSAMAAAYSDANSRSSAAPAKRKEARKAANRRPYTGDDDRQHKKRSYDEQLEAAERKRARKRPSRSSSSKRAAPKPRPPPSCAECKRRKKGCDRKRPCGRCIESGVKCSYPQVTAPASSTANSQDQASTTIVTVPLDSAKRKE